MTPNAVKKIDANAIDLAIFSDIFSSHLLLKSYVPCRLTSSYALSTSPPENRRNMAPLIRRLPNDCFWCGVIDVRFTSRWSNALRVSRCAHYDRGRAKISRSHIQRAGRCIFRVRW